MTRCEECNAWEHKTEDHDHVVIYEMAHDTVDEQET
jgi:hypothetical protein